MRPISGKGNGDILEEPAISHPCRIRSWKPLIDLQLSHPSQFVADHTCRRRSPRAALFRLTASQEQLAAVICRCLPLKMRMRCVRSGHWCRDSLHKAVDGSSVDQDACDQIMSYSPGWAHISQGFSCPLAAGIGSPASGHTSRHR